MAFTPTASWVSTNSRSNKSIKTSRFPECRVYCLNSTTGQQSGEDCICLFPIGSVMTDLTTPRVKIKKARTKCSHVVFTVSIANDSRSFFSFAGLVTVGERGHGTILARRFSLCPVRAEKRILHRAARLPPEPAVGIGRRTDQRYIRSFS